MAKNRAKFGYLTYNDMLQRVAEGVIDQHDIVFTKDTNEIFIISKDYEPIPLKNRVYVYNSLAEAIASVNRNVDTYIGQIVSILDGDVYKGYIVNKDMTGIGLTYTVLPLANQSGVDYNTLGNKPIVNLVGTLDEPITISQLDNGTYSIIGQYKVDHSESTIYLNASPTIVIVENNNNSLMIKKISSAEIVNYKIVDGTIEKNIYVTDKFLKECGYATTSYIDSKLEALNFITKEEIGEYVNQLFNNIVEDVLDAKINKKIDEKIQSVPNEHVVNLFS